MVFIQNTLLKFVEILQQNMNDSLLRQMQARLFAAVCWKSLKLMLQAVCVLELGKCLPLKTFPQCNSSDLENCKIKCSKHIF